MSNEMMKCTALEELGAAQSMISQLTAVLSGVAALLQAPSGNVATAHELAQLGCEYGWESLEHLDATIGELEGGDA